MWRRSAARVSWRSTRLRAFLDGLDEGARARSAVVVASQGHYDERALETVLAGTGGAFIGLLASRKRATMVRGVLAQAGMSETALGTIRNPVGLDIGARSAPRSRGLDPRRDHRRDRARAASSARAAVSSDLHSDLVCGMDVEIATRSLPRRPRRAELLLLLRRLPRGV